MNFTGEMSLLKNTEKSPKLGKRYGQDVEPSGFYAIKYTSSAKHLLQNPSYKLYTVNITKPLIIDITDDTLIKWKYDLASEFKAKKQNLTNKLVSKGYDAIITKYPEGDTGEIIILDTKKMREINNV